MSTSPSTISRTTADVTASLDNIHGDVENLIGTPRTDTFVGSAADNLLDGMSGADNLIGEDGDDTLIGGGPDLTTGFAGDSGDSLVGGAGVDTAVYGARAVPLTITADGNQGDGAAGENDNVATDVENVLGGSGNDIITGSANPNTLDGGPGADVVNGAGGNDVLVGIGSQATANDRGDTLVGGSGTDTADYSRSPVQVELSANDRPDDGRGVGSTAELDTIAADVENLTGSPFNDALFGNASPNTLRGGDGTDVIVGNDGVDAAFGEAGNDFMALDDGVADSADCGPGTDIVKQDRLDVAAACESYQPESLGPRARRRHRSPRTSKETAQRRHTPSR